MFLAFRFSPVVDAFKTITAYHAGDGVWVEIDCLLDGRTPLKQAHDVAETIQYCAEGLGEVDRAFVTMDCKSFRRSSSTACILMLTLLQTPRKGLQVTPMRTHRRNNACPHVIGWSPTIDVAKVL